MNWKITSPKGACTSCGRIFEENEACYSLLDMGEEGARRRDLCASCFEAGGCQEGIFWRTRMTCKGPERRKIVDFGTLRELFFRMVSRGSPEFVPMVYLLALVLVRKKYLRLVDFISRDGKDLMRVRRRRGEPSFDVEVPLLDDDGIARLKEKLADLLSADLDDHFAPYSLKGEEELFAEKEPSSAADS